MPKIASLKRPSLCRVLLLFLYTRMLQPKEKVCKTCRQSKPITAFSPSKRCVYGVLSNCKQCRALQEKHKKATDPVYAAKHRASSKGWYKANPEYQRQHVRRRSLESRMWVDSLKSHPCVDCGNDFPPCVMQFHHRDPASKLFGIAAIFSHSKHKVLAEIEKCDLLCANCHAIRTWCKISAD